MSFWKESSNTFLAVGAALAVNMMTAVVVGGLDIPPANLREEHMHFWIDRLHELSGNGAWLGAKQFSVLLFVAGLCGIYTDEPLKVGPQLRRLMNAWDTWPYKEETVILGLLTMVNSLLTEWNAMPVDINAAQVAIITERLGDLRKVSQQLKVEPIKWAIHEKVFPQGLASILTFLPVLRLVNGTKQLTHDVDFVIPGFCEPPEELDEEGSRCLL
jgi:hypothetical protein